MATDAPKNAQLTAGELAEIPKYLQDMEDMKQEIARLRSGAINDDQFRAWRLMRGIYGQRQKPDIQMIRVKIPWGRATAEQLECLADVADKFPGEDRKGVAHVTTRQAVQFHFVKLDTVPDLMKALAPAGLTTREACSNTVRNVTADELAGVASDEAFDVAPYAEATVRYFLRHPASQNLPRKFKISFSGSSADRGLNLMHDVGAMAAVKNGARGFKVYVGGGLGPTPKAAHLLEDFTPYRCR
jgi:sulfite reductase beta subunit-like hemoprotein